MYSSTVTFLPIYVYCTLAGHYNKQVLEMEMATHKAAHTLTSDACLFKLLVCFNNFVSQGKSLKFRDLIQQGIRPFLLWDTSTS
jgi:hypothetical protein